MTKKEKRKFISEIYEKVNFVHHKAIPIDYLREFSHHYRFSIGTVLIITYLALFGYAVYYFYTENTTTQFVAIEEGSNSCVEVVRPLDGSFLASSTGLWEGDVDFVYSDAPISITFRELSITTHSFVELFSGSKEKLQQINEVFIANNLAVNVLYWVSFKKSSIVGDKVQTLQLIGDPSFLFDSQIHVGVLTSGTAVCKSQPTTTFDSQSGNFEISYSFDDYKSSSSGCETVFDYYSIAFAISMLNTQVNIYIDSRSFLTAMALNSGVVVRETNYDFDINDRQSVSIGGSSWTYYNLKDIRYPGMTPIFCIQGGWCVVQVGQVLALPIFDHYGDNILLTSTMKPCSCDSGNGMTARCNTFDFILGLLQVGSTEDGVNTTAWLPEVTKIQKRFSGNYNLFNEYWVPAVRIQVSVNTTPAIAMSVVAERDPGAHLISLRSIKLQGSVISKYAFELHNGSCSAALNKTLANWDNLANNPPLMLVEPYLKCYRNKEFSMLDALGVGMADSDLFMRLTAYLILPVLLLFIKFCSGVELVDPSEHTLDSFTEVLHKARQVDAGRSKERGNTETRLQITSKDREAAAEIIRLLTIALEEEEEEEEEEAIGGRFKVVPVKSYAEASQEEVVPIG